MTESTTRPTAKEGGCACGAIRYRFEGEPLFVHACHCKHCQRLTGSAFGITMVVAADDFELLSGEPAQGEIRGDSGGRKSAHWCPSCGSYLWARAERRPGCVSIRPGTLDETDWFAPGAHIWIRSKQDWVALPADIPAFDKAYDPVDLWPAESLRRVAVLDAR